MTQRPMRNAFPFREQEIPQSEVTVLITPLLRESLLTRCDRPQKDPANVLSLTTSTRFALISSLCFSYRFKRTKFPSPVPNNLGHSPFERVQLHIAYYEFVVLFCFFSWLLSGCVLA